MTDQKYCPLQKEGVQCARWCAWYDEAEQQCAMMNIAAELVAMSEDVQYTITEKCREYLKGAGEHDRN
mgnify:FL=1